MNVWILRKLRTATRAWWAHVALRQRNEIEEAASRERQSIRSNLDIIRKTLASNGAYISTGVGGTTVHYSRGCTLSSYGRLEHMAVAQVLVQIGLPLVDTRSVANKARLIGLPLVAVGHEPDPAPWTSMSYAPLTEYAARAKALGAVVVNFSHMNRTAA
ncbi:hypothetical protein [Palleronia sp.]|uniref:hypothetical protein n=1 Tax=Palleronia sp. TaxID=1940284 RepID=UPI0035C817BC